MGVDVLWLREVKALAPTPGCPASSSDLPASAHLVLLQFASPTTCGEISKHNAPQRRSKPAKRRKQRAESAVPQPAVLEDGPGGVRVTLRGASPFAYHWGAAEEELWRAIDGVSDKEVEAMIAAAEEDGWGAWVG